VISLRHVVLVVTACSAAGALSCSRADVYPITRDPFGDGGDIDGGVDGGPDGGTDGGPDGGTDGGPDGGTDGGPDGGVDGGTDAGVDGSVEPPACSMGALEPGDTQRTVLVDSTMRSYVLHVPESYDATLRVPLVLDFHGIGESGTAELQSSPYPATLDPEGVVMAFPDGLRGPAGAGWNVGPCCVADVDDVAFARAVVADVQEIACIDASRVYAVGVLTGGGMAHYLGCHAADVFAAVSPAAFDLLEENVDDCNPPRGVSVIAFRGTADTRVPYEGGPSALVPGMPLTFLGAQATFEKWAEIDGCTGTPSAPDENGCSTYSSCEDGAEVTLCTKENGGLDPGEPSIAWPALKRHAL
jgi:polyhydroxybutyrate depolymerase